MGRATVLAALYIAIQAALITTGDERIRGAFGFRMFPESSTLRAHLARRVGPQRKLVPVEHGEWQGRDSGGGGIRTIRWRDWVPQRELSRFDGPVTVSYTLESHVAEFHAALDYVASRIPKDGETYALVLVVDGNLNGHERRHFEFESEVPAEEDERDGRSR